MLSKEDNKSEDNFNMKLNVKSNNLKFNTDIFNEFNVGDIVEDYKGNIGYISEIITKNIIFYNKIVKAYRYKWQPLYIESNELNLKTPISLFYKRIGTHIFITRENEEQVAKRREALQKAHRFRREADNLGECCKKLSKDIENHTEKFFANNTKSIESAKKVTEQIRNVVKNVKTFIPDDFNNVKPIATKVVNTKTTNVKSTDVKSIEQIGEFENLNKYLKTDNNSPSILHDTPTHDTPTHDTPTHDTPTHDTPTHDTPTLPKKLYFNTSEYDITSNGNYNEKKEEALCNTINDIIEFLKYLE